MDDGQDRHVQLDERILGAFGGIHRWPHSGKRPTTDVTAAVLHTLADLYCHIAVPSLAGRRILFHFDYQDGQVQVTCRRSLQDAEATLTVVP